MNNIRALSLLVVAVVLALPVAVVLGAGPSQVGGSLPYSGDGAGGFTIDHVAFDRSDVTAAPCPVGATCVNMSATSADHNFLVREVTVPDFFGGYRYIQTIFAESDAVEGDFIYEAMVSPRTSPTSAIPSTTTSVPSRSSMSPTPATVRSSRAMRSTGVTSSSITATPARRW
jgi:hypothetical protein